jgi:hypothetical protein
MTLIGVAPSNISGQLLYANVHGRDRKVRTQNRADRIAQLRLVSDSRPWETANADSMALWTSRTRSSLRSKNKMTNL